MWNKSERWAAMKQLNTLVIEDAEARKVDYKGRGINTVGEYIDDQRDHLSTTFIETAIEILSGQERVTDRQQQTINRLKERLQPVN